MTDASPSQEKKSDAADDEITPSDELFEKNLEAFKTHLPAVFRFIDGHKPVSALRYLENGEPNIEFQGFSMYPDGAITHAKRQTDQLQAHSFRLQMGSPGEEGLDFHSSETFSRMVKRFNESGFRYAQTPVREASYFLIVQGIGLAQHITELVERTQCRVLILIEPNIDLFYQSLFVFDWLELFERFHDGGVLEFFLSGEPETLGRRIQTIFRRFNPTGMDGTTVFRHYSSTVFQETERQLPNLLRTAVMGLGFYQDEINMISQSYKNLEKGDSRIFRQLGENPNIPAFVVGSGPSLEHLLPFIKANADKAVIFSCGTSVDILLKNGIKPDFWVIAERDVQILNQAQETHELYGVSDIHFAGSTTIFPGVYEMFKDAIFFFRPGLSCTPLFATATEQIAQVPDPLAANAGLSVSLHLGFREFYFFGVDTGSKSQTKAHAKGSWYERHDAENILDLPIPLPGNFGGTVWTTPEFQWSKENIEKLTQSATGRTFYNLGDGALIKGTSPKHPKAVRIADPIVSKKDVIETLIMSCPEYSVAQFEDSWEHKAIIDRLFGFCEELKDATRQEDDPSNFGFVHKTSELLRPQAAADALEMLLRGSLFTTIICHEFFANRLTTPEERSTMTQIFKDEYCDMIDRLRDRAVEVFMELENGKPWEQFQS